MFQLQGKLIKINDTKKVSDKFSVREFVVEESSSQYPQLIQMQVTQDKCVLLDGFTLGQDIMINFNIKGREWTSPQGEVKYFTTLEAWKLDATGSPEVMGEALESSDLNGVNKDDLPF